MTWTSNIRKYFFVIKSKIEKVPRGIRGEIKIWFSFYIKNSFLNIRKICWFLSTSIRQIEFLIFEITISDIF